MVLRATAGVKPASALSSLKLFKSTAMWFLYKVIVDSLYTILPFLSTIYTGIVLQMLSYTFFCVHLHKQKK